MAKDRKNTRVEVSAAPKSGQGMPKSVKTMRPGVKIVEPSASPVKGSGMNRG